MNRKKLAKIKKKILNSKWFKVELVHCLSQDFKIQVNKLWDKNFGAGSGRDEQELIEGKDKFCSKPYAYLLATEKDSVIGVTSLFKRKIDYNGQRIVLGGFGGLCTKKERRGIGIATTLLKRGMQEFELQNCDVAFLNTDINDSMLVKLYTKVGFVPLGKPYTYLGKSGKRYTDNNGMIAPIESKNKFNHIRKSKTVLDIGIGNW